MPSQIDNTQQKAQGTCPGPGRRVAQHLPPRNRRSRAPCAASLANPRLHFLPAGNNFNHNSNLLPPCPSSSLAPGTRRMHILGLPSCLLQLIVAQEAVAWPETRIGPPAVPERLNTLLQTCVSSFRHLYPQTSQGRLNVWEVVQVMAWCSLLPGLWYLQRKPKAKSADKEGKAPNNLLLDVADPHMVCRALK